MNRVDLCALPFYRPNLWNGRSCKPALVQVGEGRVRAIDHEEQVLFDDALTDVRCRVTRLGTLKLRVRGRPFAFYGRGGAVSPEPNPVHAAYVSRFWGPSAPYPHLREPLFGGTPTARMKALCRALVQGGARAGR